MNDLVSREAAMAAVENAISGIDTELKSGDDIPFHDFKAKQQRREGLRDARNAIAALPAAGDERWEKLRALSAKVIKEADIQHSLYPDCFLEGLGDAINDMRRSYLSPPPQEAGDHE